MISKKTKYALKALVYLAKHKIDGPVLISQIAEIENIPHKFLEAILLELKKSGILSSKKGKGGGYYLIKDPNKVNVAEIMRLIDGPIALLPCITYMYYERCDECMDENSCGIRNVFKEVRDTTVEILKKATLTELINTELNLCQNLDKKNKL